MKREGEQMRFSLKFTLENDKNQYPKLRDIGREQSQEKEPEPMETVKFMRKRILAK